MPRPSLHLVVDGIAGKSQETSVALRAELQARVEKLERKNAKLRVKNKKLRLLIIEISETMDALQAD